MQIKITLIKLTKIKSRTVHAVGGAVGKQALLYIAGRNPNSYKHFEENFGNT